MSVTCIVQARMGSTRFPGKVLEPIGDRPLLRLLLDRLQPLAVDHLVVATTTLPHDEPVVALAHEAGVEVVRGSEADVLGRFGLALEIAPADVVVRLTADCPLLDPGVVEGAISLRDERDADYVSNTLIRTYPDGLDVEVIRASALLAAVAEATDPVEREHVTPFVYRHPERFRLVALRTPKLLGNERWTVDTPDDLDRLRTDLAGREDLITAGWLDLLPALGERAVPEPGALVLRPALGADRDVVLAWRNDPVTVRFSTTHRAVPVNEHREWFDRVVDDPGHRLWIGMIDGTPVGQVRVDVDAGVGTVSIAVAPERRGSGLAPQLLSGLIDALSADRQVRRLVAHIASDNDASRRAFARVGFVVRSDDAGWITAELDLEVAATG